MEIKERELVFTLKDQLLIFQSLSDLEMEYILPFFEIRFCKAGDALFTEGDPSGFISFILSGKLEVKKGTEFAGTPIVLGTLNKGSFIGETALISDNEPRAATAIALEDTQVLILSNESLEDIIQKHPETGAKILKELLKFVSFRLIKALEKLAATF
jgi:CRP-like cAMP-binding protein